MSSSQTEMLTVVTAFTCYFPLSRFVFYIVIIYFLFLFPYNINWAFSCVITKTLFPSLSMFPFPWKFSSHRGGLLPCQLYRWEVTVLSNWWPSRSDHRPCCETGQQAGVLWTASKLGQAKAFDFKLLVAWSLNTFVAMPDVDMVGLALVCC